MVTREDDDIPDLAMEQASDWMFRIEAHPEDAILRARLEEWLSADAAHVQAWDLARRAWSLTGQTEPAFADQWHSAAPTSAQARRRSRSWRRHERARPQRNVALRRAAAPVAAAAAVALFLLAPSASLWLRADYATATAENRAVRLEDGSQIVLGGGSAVAKRFTNRRRGIELLSGEAFFDVAHNSARPFVVGASDMTVTVTGTAFDVSMTERTLSVAVARGSVRVERDGQPPVEVALKPGQRVNIDRASGEAATDTLSLPEIAAWRSRRLAARGEALADVVETLDRHFTGTILFADSELKERRVTGVYDLDDPVRALRALTGPYGGTVRRITPWLLVVSGS